MSFPAEKREAAVAGRIRALAANAAFNPETLRIQESDVVSQILVDRLVVIGVYDADASADGTIRSALATLQLESTDAVHVKILGCWLWWSRYS